MENAETNTNLTIKEAIEWFDLVDSDVARAASSYLRLVEKQMQALEYQVKSVKKNYRSQKKKTALYKSQLAKTLSNSRKAALKEK